MAAMNHQLDLIRHVEPMTSIVFYIPAVKDTQTWEFTMHFQDAAQFSPGTIVQQQAAPPPSGDPDLHARAQAMLAGGAHIPDMEL